MKEKETKPTQHEPTNTISLPKRDKGKKVWIIISTLLFISTVGLGIFGYIKFKGFSEKAPNQQAQVDDTHDGGDNWRLIPELGVKYRVTQDNINTTYAYLAHPDPDSSTEEIISSIGLSNTELVALGSRQLNKYTNENDCTATSSPLGIISRYRAGTKVAEAGGKKIEDYPNKAFKKILVSTIF